MDQEPDTKKVVEQFMRSVTIPILYAHKDATYSVAGGTLFTINGRYFVVTVRHLFDDLQPEHLAYPENRVKAQISTLGVSTIYKLATPEVDVAVVELRDEVTIKNLKAGWQFLTLDSVAPPSKNGLFALMGYPSKMSPQKGEWVVASGVVVYSLRMEAPEDVTDANHETDLFFQYGKTLFRDGTDEIDAPELQGTSGSSVWELVDNPGGLWVPGKMVKVVGVQSAYKRGSYFRVVSWGSVAHLFRQIDAELADAMMKVLEP